MKKKPVDDDDFDIYREEDEEEVENKSAPKLKRPGQQLSSVTIQPRKSIRTGKIANEVSTNNKRSEPSEEDV